MLQARRLVTMPVPEPTTEDPHAWAKAYAQRGWRVLPIKPGEKRPPMAAWQDAATTDEATIDAWWTQLYKGHGIGVATGKGSGIFVLDVDVSDQKAGDDTLADLIAAHGQLPDAPTVLTPSMGCHIYFALPEGMEIRNDASRRLGPGLDIRGEGGQVVAPPTTRAEGGYEWEDDSFLLDPPQAPAWLLALLAAPAVAPSPAPSVASMPRLEDGYSPADAFNERTTWAQLLERDGWTLSGRNEEGYEEWTRPGKDPRHGASATVGWNGLDILRVFTTSIDWLTEGAYSRFQYEALSQFAGDESRAAREIRLEDFENVEAFLDALPVSEPEQAAAPTEVPEGMETGWEPVDLALVLSEGYEPPRPDLLRRSDGAALLYRGRINALYGESGSGKSWIAMAACAQVIAEGGTVLYIDLEDHVGSVMARMMGLGLTAEQLMAGFLYVSPQVAWSGFAALQLVQLIEGYDVQLAVIDSTGEAMALDGAEPNSDDDTARWFRQVPRTLAQAGPAVLLLDHVPKASDAPKGFAIGSQRKRAAIDGASYRVEVITAPARGAKGHLKMITAKDRGGAYQHGEKVAEVYVEDGIDSAVDLAITPPEMGTKDRLKVEMTKWMRNKPAQVSSVLLKAVGGNQETRRAALNELVADGYLTEAKKGNARYIAFARLYLAPSEEALDDACQQDLI